MIKMAKTKIKTVVAKVTDVTEPQYDATFKCPYCKEKDYINDIDEENVIIEQVCWNCKTKYKVKIPDNIF